jgi:uncharacterized protein YhaN
VTAEQDMSGAEVSADQAPVFAIALRGYDRDQVDEYLHRHEAWARDWRERASAAESAAAAAHQRVGELSRQVSQLAPKGPSSTSEALEALGDQVGGILQAAYEAAESMRAEAEAEAKTKWEKTETEVKKFRETAKREIESRRAALDREIRSLVERRDSVVSHLGSLQRDLAALLGAGRPVEELAQSDPQTAVVDLRDRQPAEKAVSAKGR